MGIYSFDKYIMVMGRYIMIIGINPNRCRGYTLGIYADVKAESVGKLSALSNMPTYSEYVGRFANFRLYRNQYRHNR